MGPGDPLVFAIIEIYEFLAPKKRPKLLTGILTEFPFESPSI